MENGKRIIENIMKSYARIRYLNGDLSFLDIIKYLDIAKNELEDIEYSIKTYGESDELIKSRNEVSIEIDALRFYYKLNLN